MRLAALLLLASVLLSPFSQAQGPVFKIKPEQSSVKFFVKASVAIQGNFEKWDATLTYPSTDANSGVLDIKIQAATVNTGSGMKDDKLKAKTSSTPSRTLTSHSIPRRLLRPAPIPLMCSANLRSVVYPKTKP